MVNEGSETGQQGSAPAHTKTSNIAGPMFPLGSEFDPYVHEDPSIRESLHIRIDDPYTWNPDTTGECSYSRILIHRDYSQGHTVMKFPENVPTILVKEMHVSPRAWKITFEEINKICVEAGKVSYHTVLDTLADCFFCFICRRNYTDKCLDRLVAYIKEENRTVYDRLGLQFQNPVLNGCRYIEVVIKYLRFQSVKPILHWGPDYPQDLELAPWEVDNWPAPNKSDKRREDGELGSTRATFTTADSGAVTNQHRVREATKFVKWLLVEPELSDCSTMPDSPKLSNELSGVIVIPQGTVDGIVELESDLKLTNTATKENIIPEAMSISVDENTGNANAGSKVHTTIEINENEGDDHEENLKPELENVGEDQEIESSS